MVSATYQRRAALLHSQLLFQFKTGGVLPKMTRESDK